MPSIFSYEYPSNHRTKLRHDYIKKLMGKGCSLRKAESVAWRKFR
jgi:hypothetical protein